MLKDSNLILGPSKVLEGVFLVGQFYQIIVLKEMTSIFYQFSKSLFSSSEKKKRNLQKLSSKKFSFT